MHKTVGALALAILTFAAAACTGNADNATTNGATPGCTAPEPEAASSEIYALIDGEPSRAYLQWAPAERADRDHGWPSLVTRWKLPKTTGQPHYQISYRGSCAQSDGSVISRYEIQGTSYTIIRGTPTPVAGGKYQIQPVYQGDPAVNAVEWAITTDQQGEIVAMEQTGP